jgi:hypothetical protein
VFDMTARVRSVIVAALALAAVLAAGYTAYWFHVAGEARKGLLAWTEARRAQGWSVELGEPEIEGFPMKLRIRVEKPVLVSPHGLSWRAERLTARATPFRLRHIKVAAPGRHELNWPGGAAVVTAPTLDLVINLEKSGELDDVTLVASRVKAETPELGLLAIDNLAATVDPQPLPPKPTFETTSALFILAAQGLELPAGWAPLFDRHVAYAEVKARVQGVLPEGALARSVDAWSQAGGTVEITHLGVDWAPLAMEGEGTLAFDPRLQPLAALSTRVRGYGELMDRLNQAGIIDTASAGAGKLLLGVMAKPDPRGRPTLPVPMTVQDGGLYLGPARVWNFPPLVWPQG